MKRTVGVDLAGVESRPTGICLLKASLEASFFTAYKTSQILEAVERFKPEIVGVDAPLNLPGEGNLRPCDRMLIHRGIRVLPPTLGGMRKLTLRAIELKEKLEGRGFKTLECFPGAVRILLKLPGKNRPEATLQSLKKLGLKFPGGVKPTSHEADAVLTALTARLHLEGLAEIVGDPETGQIAIPKPEALQWLKTYPRPRLKHRRGR